MEETRHKTLILILARELATNLATPVFVVDPEGTLVFYNEAAEGILGDPFDVVGQLTRDQWATMFSPEAPDGTPLQPEQLPLVRALKDHAPAHAQIRITGRDEVRRDIAVTAFPLLVGGEEFAGAVAIFWERGTAEGHRGPPGTRGPGGNETG
ncbi:MAG TPA: PAS domain-containing protein [Actinomycetota bacterium]|nr:PAS domain-containing protein [Actinomycetota bacterium]